MPPLYVVFQCFQLLLLLTSLNDKASHVFLFFSLSFHFFGVLVENYNLLTMFFVGFSIFSASQFARKHFNGASSKDTFYGPIFIPSSHSSEKVSTRLSPFLSFSLHNYYGSSRILRQFLNIIVHTFASIADGSVALLSLLRPITVREKFSAEMISLYKEQFKCYVNKHNLESFTADGQF